MRDAREPDIDLAWLTVEGTIWFKPEMELDRFNADAGWGIPLL